MADPQHMDELNATATALANITPCSPLTSAHRFRFLDLPKDIRRMVYDVLNEDYHLSRILPEGCYLFYEDAGGFWPSVFRGNEFLYAEATHAWEVHLAKTPITISIKLYSLRYAMAVMDALEAARPLDNYQSFTDSVPNQALALGSAKLRSKLHYNTPEYDHVAAKAFLRVALLKLRRNPLVNFRLLCYRNASVNGIITHELPLLVGLRCTCTIVAFAPHVRKMYAMYKWALDLKSVKWDVATAEEEIRMGTQYH
jgi:hypothetical protein